MRNSCLLKPYVKIALRRQHQSFYPEKFQQRNCSFCTGLYLIQTWFSKVFLSSSSKCILRLMVITILLICFQSTGDYNIMYNCQKWRWESHKISTIVNGEHTPVRNVCVGGSCYKTSQQNECLVIYRHFPTA